MKLAKTILLILGALLVLAGLTWMGQGAGIIRYPVSSFMIDQSPWIWRGALTAVVGAICIVFSRRM